MKTRFSTLTLRRLGVFVCVLGLLVSFSLAMPAPTTYAVMVGCRGDPLIRLTNGGVLHIGIQVDAAAEQVDSILYIVHLSPHDQVASVVYTGGALKSKESVEFVYDGQPDTYWVETYVTAKGDFQVQVDFEVIVNVRIKSQNVSVIGWSGQALSLELQR